MATVFIKNGPIFKIGSDQAFQTFDKLPTGTYVVQFNPDMGFFLEPIEEVALPKKIYGNPEKDAQRILNTFNDRTRSTGVLLEGEKGSGKTMLARLVSHRAAEQGIPTLIINTPFVGDGFSTFMSHITQPVVVLFDEFEKVYDKDHQPYILTLLDGVFGGQKLYILTVNDRYKIDAHMTNRPGRIFYQLSYKGLSSDFIKEYAEDNLKNKDHVRSVIAVANLFRDFNFDMLQAIIEDMNRYGETASEVIRILNAKPEGAGYQTYKVNLKTIPGFTPRETQKQWTGNPLIGYTHFNSQITEEQAPEGVEVFEEEEQKDGGNWYLVSFDTKDLVSFDPIEGRYHFKNKLGFELTLTKEVIEASKSVSDRLKDLAL